MFWIMGGDTIFVVLAAFTGWPLLTWWSGQLEHVPWHGFQFMDLIFPLFLFIAGVSFPFSVARRFQGQTQRSALYRHIFRRGLLLVLFGIIYNNAIRFNPEELRYASVLGRIGLAWMFGALIFINFRQTGRIIWFFAILVGYWLLLLLVTAPDSGVDDPFSQPGNLAGYIDRMILPGKFCCYGFGDNEGLLSTLPAICTALLGMFTGQFIQSDFLRDQPMRKVRYMLIAALLLIVTGKAWSYVFPLNKYLWSSSFVCFVGGLSLLLFTLFYLVVDLWQWKKWTRFFVVIGMNSITIYLAEKMIDFSHTAQFLFGGVIELFPASFGNLLSAMATFATAWLFLYLLYRKKIFLKV